MLAPFCQYFYTFADMRKLVLHFIGIAGLIASASCGRDSRHSGTSTPQHITRLEQTIKNGIGGDSLARRGLTLLLHGFGFPDAGRDDTLLAHYTDSLRVSPAFTFFEPDVTAFYPDLDALSADLGHIRSVWDYGPFPDNFYTAVSPYTQSIITYGNSDLIVVLNHYLGRNYKAYESFPSWILELKTSDRIAYDVIHAIISTNYPLPERPVSLVNRMVYEGAVITAQMESIDSASICVAIGWTDDQLKWARDNERSVWQFLAANDMIYSDSPTLADRIINPSPSTSFITPDSPGSLGKYIGYMIVRSYLDNHKDVHIADFLRDSIYLRPTVLQESGYRP